MGLNAKAPDIFPGFFYAASSIAFGVELIRHAYLVLWNGVMGFGGLTDIFGYCAEASKSKCKRQQQIPFGDDNKKGKGNSRCFALLRMMLVAGVRSWEVG
jgi:hypothetical protein